jgi:molybdopterin adenylyltransferase
VKVGRLTLSDRAAQGIYEDVSGPEIERVVGELFEEELEFVRALLPDEQDAVERKLLELVDIEHCPLVITTGGTGPSARDVTPEATRMVIEKELPGFGEAMRMHSFARVKTAILSRGLAGIRGRSLIINLPGQPAAIGEILPVIGPAIAEALDHVAGFRPRLRDPGGRS